MGTEKVFLVVDDDKQIRSFITFALKAQGYKCIEASKGKDAIQTFIAENIDIIILDLGLPDMDGLDIIRQIRDFSEVPIVVVSGRDQDKEKVEALDVGADDYLTKPFSVNELLARIRVMLRRLEKNVTILPKVYTFGDLEVNIEKHSVFLEGKEIHLTSMEFKIIETLVQNPGKVLTHSNLLKAVWGSHLESDTQTLRVFMANIRRKIEKSPTNPQYIITEVGVGYRFVGE
ncbi:MAG: response regulator transcription factor [Oscillospiraceae bacterium]